MGTSWGVLGASWGGLGGLLEASLGVLGSSSDDLSTHAYSVFIALLVAENHSMEISWTLSCTNALPVLTLAQVSILASFGLLEAPMELPSRSKTLPRRSKSLPRGSKTLFQDDPRRSKMTSRRSKGEIWTILARFLPLWRDFFGTFSVLFRTSKPTRAKTPRLWENPEKHCRVASKSRFSVCAHASKIT